MKEKLARFMSGRYGVDQLSRLYLGIALILLVVSIFSHLGIFYIAGIVLLVLAVTAAVFWKKRKRKAGGKSRRQK